ncbi:hypothetical protein FB45DRAFT_1009388 [Roridomyces roridus]|uniref:Uncharacterized protein n=1 Tax=Roridomyces roridus TaxID=1738132 RepID=A0AAD7B733_9AGAR|nr:hypothetical protein FB45DRAFT_1009388 [Roridomyces roridus]
MLPHEYSPTEEHSGMGLVRGESQSKADVPPLHIPKRLIWFEVHHRLYTRTFQKTEFGQFAETYLKISGHQKKFGQFAEKYLKISGSPKKVVVLLQSFQKFWWTSSGRFFLMNPVKRDPTCLSPPSHSVLCLQANFKPCTTTRMVQERHYVLESHPNAILATFSPPVLVGQLSRDIMPLFLRDIPYIHGLRTTVTGLVRPLPQLLPIGILDEIASSFRCVEYLHSVCIQKRHGSAPDCPLLVLYVAIPRAIRWYYPECGAVTILWETSAEHPGPAGTAGRWTKKAT